MNLWVFGPAKVEGLYRLMAFDSEYIYFLYSCYFLCVLILDCKVMPAIRIIKMPLMIGRLQHLQPRNQISRQIIPLPQIQTV